MLLQTQQGSRPQIAHGKEMFCLRDNVLVGLDKI
jgi:hypothetical protein